MIEATNRAILAQALMGIATREQQSQAALMLATDAARLAELESRIREIKAWIETMANMYANEEDGNILLDLKRNWPGAWLKNAESSLDGAGK